MLKDLRMGGPRLDERTTHRLDELQQFQAPGAVLGDLAGATRDDVLVTFAACLCIERRPQPVGDRFHFFEDEPVVVEGTQRDHRVFVDVVECRTLRVETVGAIVECGGCLAIES